MTVSRGRFTTVPAEQAMGGRSAPRPCACAIATAASGGPLGVVFAQPGALAIVAFAGIFAAGIPSILFLTGIRAIGGTRAGILMLFEPLVGVTLAGAAPPRGADADPGRRRRRDPRARRSCSSAARRPGRRMEPAAVPSVEHG